MARRGRTGAQVLHMTTDPFQRKKPPPRPRPFTPRPAHTRPHQHTYNGDGYCTVCQEHRDWIERPKDQT